MEAALRADPPIPVVYRASTSLDVDHLRHVDGVELVVDESAAVDAFADAVLSALRDGDGHHGGG
jgi:hypothetical protein